MCLESSVNLSSLNIVYTNISCAQRLDQVAEENLLSELTLL